MKKLNGWAVMGLAMGVLGFNLAHAGPCEAQKQALLAKKGVCHDLPKEQRAACRAERQQLKSALESCKAQAKASKGQDKAMKGQ